MTRAREPFRRLEDGRIALRLPRNARELVVAATRRLEETGTSAGSPGFERLFGRIDESAAVDDPAYVFARQLAVDEILQVVSASAYKKVLEPYEAEAWLKVLGMSLSRWAAELGIDTEEQRAALGAEDEALIRVVYALQAGLVDAIDGTEPA